MIFTPDTKLTLSLKTSSTFVSLTGGYYLTSVYASLCLIQSLDREQPMSGCLTPEAQETLKEWSCRRSREAQRQKEIQQNQVTTEVFDGSSTHWQHYVWVSVVIDFIAVTHRCPV